MATIKLDGNEERDWMEKKREGGLELKNKKKIDSLVE